MSQAEKHNLCLQIMVRLPNNILCLFFIKKKWIAFVSYAWVALVGNIGNFPEKSVKIPINTNISDKIWKYYRNFHGPIIGYGFCVGAGWSTIFLSEIVGHFNPSLELYIHLIMLWLLHTFASINNQCVKIKNMWFLTLCFHTIFYSL